MQSQFRFDNECNLNLPDNHRRVSEWGDLETELEPPEAIHDPQASEPPRCMTEQWMRSVSMLCVLYLDHFFYCIISFSQ